MLANAILLAYSGYFLVCFWPYLTQIMSVDYIKIAIAEAYIGNISAKNTCV